MNAVSFTGHFDACVGHAALDGATFVRDFPAKAAVLKDKGDYIHFEGKDGKSYKATRTGTGPNDFKVVPS